MLTWLCPVGQNLFCALCRWFLFRLHESPRYLVSNGREEEAVLVLRAIATYNDNEIPIHAADVQADAEHGEVPREADLENDKKNSELPTPTLPSPPMNDERSPLPQFLAADPETSRLSSDNSNSRPSSRSSRNYDALGQGAPPPAPKRPIRMGSAFYRDTSLTLEPDNHFEESFGEAVENGDADDEHTNSNGDAAGGSLLRRPSEKSLGGRKSLRSQASSGLDGWKRQMKKLFAPQWRRTVILMWIIWASMAFGMSDLLSRHRCTS